MPEFPPCTEDLSSAAGAGEELGDAGADSGGRNCFGAGSMVGVGQGGGGPGQTTAPQWGSAAPGPQGYLRPGAWSLPPCPPPALQQERNAAMPWGVTWPGPTGQIGGGYAPQQTQWGETHMPWGPTAPQQNCWRGSVPQQHAAWATGLPTPWATGLPTGGSTPQQYAPPWGTSGSQQVTVSFLSEP